MPTYFVGSCLDALEAVGDPSQVFEVSGPAMRLGTWAQATAGIRASLRSPQTGALTAVTDLWLRAYVAIGGVTFSNTPHSSATTLYLYNSEGTPVVRLFHPVDGRVSLQYKVGTAWTDVGPNVPFSTCEFHVRVKIGAADGELALYIGNETAIRAVGIDTSALLNVTSAMFHDSRADRGSDYSGILVASYSTIGHKVTRQAPTSDGTETAWAGNYTGVDETPQNDLDFVSTSTPAARETFKAGALSPLANAVVKCVAVAARSRSPDNAGPRDLSLAIKRGSTVYTAPGAQPLLEGFVPVLRCWDTDPATGTDWSAPPAASDEFGLVAAG